MRYGSERRREARHRRRYSAEVDRADGKRLFTGRVWNISRHGVRLKGLLATDKIAEGLAVKVKIIVEDIDPAKAAEVLNLTGKVRWMKIEPEGADIAIFFDSPFPLTFDGRLRRLFKEFFTTCFTERPRY